MENSSSSSSSSAAVRKIFQTLVASAIGRCRMSGNPCRLSISLKCFHDSQPQSVRIAISDTGAGSSLEEFQGLEDCLAPSAASWDGVLTITTTSINEKDIYHYTLNLRETPASAGRLKKLPSTPKHGRKFSGTEVSLATTEENVGSFTSWVAAIVQKIQILKIPMIAFELVVEHTRSQGSTCEHILQATDDVFQPLPSSSIACLSSGLEDYVLKHGNALDKEFQSCFSSREHLKVGTGQASSAENLKGTGRVVEAVIVAVDAAELSKCFLSPARHMTTEVLYFQDFSPCSIPEASLNAMKRIDWQNYGLSLRTATLNADTNTVLEWDDLPPNMHIDIALHCYHKQVVIPQTRRVIPADGNLLKKAIKLALDDLKAKYTGLFLSRRALKIRDCAPNLSRAIAGLILSSNNSDFQGECASLLGIHPLDVSVEGRVESCIQEKIVGIIEMNDRKPKGHKEDALPCLFECESIFLEENYCDEEDEQGEIDGILDLEESD